MTQFLDHQVLNAKLNSQREQNLEFLQYSSIIMIIIMIWYDNCYYYLNYYRCLVKLAFWRKTSRSLVKLVLPHSIYS